KNRRLSEKFAQAIKQCAELPSVDYEVQRHGIADGLGVRVGVLDSEVEKRRAESPTQDHSVSLADPEPWPNAVDGAALLEEVQSAFTSHLTLPPGAATALATWILFAHAHDAFQVSPIIAVTSPEPECGKSTLLMLLSAMTPRPLPASNITAACLFRAVEEYCPTPVIDDDDTF